MIILLLFTNLRVYCMNTYYFLTCTKKLIHIIMFLKHDTTRRHTHHLRAHNIISRTPHIYQQLNYQCENNFPAHIVIFLQHYKNWLAFFTSSDNCRPVGLILKPDKGIPSTNTPLVSTYHAYSTIIKKCIMTIVVTWSFTDGFSTNT